MKKDLFYCDNCNLETRDINKHSWITMSKGSVISIARGRDENNIPNPVHKEATWEQHFCGYNCFVSWLYSPTRIKTMKLDIDLERVDV